MRDLDDLPAKPWAATGALGRKPNIINSLYLKEEECHANNLKLKEKYDRIEQKEKRSETYACRAEKLDVLVVAYGTMARICKTAADEVKKTDKKKIGVFRPISLWPYPYEALAKVAQKARKILVVEMSMGQMVDDVKLAVLGKTPIEFYGLTGGLVPSPDDVADRLRRMAD